MAGIPAVDDDRDNPPLAGVAEISGHFKFSHPMNPVAPRSPFSPKMSFEVTLGNGEVIRKSVNHTSHTSGVLVQDLNGCIAEGVIALLNDPAVKAYQAQ